MNRKTPLAYVGEIYGEISEIADSLGEYPEKKIFRTDTE